MKKLLLLLFLAPLWNACSTARIYSVHSQGHPVYSKILVYADYSNLIQKHDYEWHIADEFEFRGIKAYRSIDLFPPLKEYDSAYYEATQQNYGYEAILYIIPEGVSTSSHSTAYKNWFGSISSSSHEEIDAVYSTLILIDARTKQKTYYASFISGGELNIMAENLGDDLQKFGYLNSNERKVSYKK